jgi:glycine hydroxymethyltransferase
VICKQQFAETLDKAVMPGMQGGPLMHSIAAKAVGFLEALQPEFATYQRQVIVNAQAMAAEFVHLGYRIVAGGTDNHLFIVDLRSKNVTGRQAEVALEKAGITVSRSCIPFDPQKPWITSGIRIGTPAITTRGMGVQECIEMVHLIDEVILRHTDEAFLSAMRQRAKLFCLKYPINLL